MSRKPKRIYCKKCLKDGFVSERGLWQHERIKHPYIPPPPPIKTIEQAPMLDDYSTLLNGKNLRIGDVIWLGRKCVITKITRTEGSDDIDVELKITKRWYSVSELN